MGASQEKEYDENEAIVFIKNFLPQDLKNKYNDDDILIVIDIIFDYYEDKGFFDVSADEDEESDLSVTDLVGYVKNQLRKDPDNIIEMDDVMNIVLGELEYEESLGMYL
ncbi:MAG: hypothetical protein PHR45_09080 [Muribaculaceae bacterium]|nr:hypothetical protein [Muribaculaceae bacterium]